MAYFYLHVWLGVVWTAANCIVVKSFFSVPFNSTLGFRSWSHWRTSGGPCLFSSPFDFLYTRRIDLTFSGRRQTKQFKTSLTVKMYLYCCPLNVTAPLTPMLVISIWFWVWTSSAPIGRKTDSLLKCVFLCVCTFGQILNCFLAQVMIYFFKRMMGF